MMKKKEIEEYSRYFCNTDKHMDRYLKNPDGMMI